MPTYLILSGRKPTCRTRNNKPGQRCSEMALSNWSILGQFECNRMEQKMYYDVAQNVMVQGIQRRQVEFSFKGKIRGNDILGFVFCFLGFFFFARLWKSMSAKFRNLNLIAKNTGGFMILRKELTSGCDSLSSPPAPPSSKPFVLLLKASSYQHDIALFIGFS